MISSQLGRCLLGGAEASPDEHRASPDDEGDYGALMDAIDRAVDGVDEGPGPAAA